MGLIKCGSVIISLDNQISEDTDFIYSEYADRKISKIIKIVNC